jgi:hypothetical protein
LKRTIQQPIEETRPRRSGGFRLCQVLFQLSDPVLGAVQAQIVNQDSFREIVGEVGLIGRRPLNERFGFGVLRLASSRFEAFE